MDLIKANGEGELYVKERVTVALKPLELTTEGSVLGVPAATLTRKD